MIALFTDFGWAGPYVGQMKSVLLARAPAVPVIDLMHDAPAFRPDLAAPLLAALVAGAPPGVHFLCVVDPGVGTERLPLALRVGGRWLVGPDNGLLAATARRLGGGEWFRISWQPERLSASFHGRDLFAPVMASLVLGEGGVVEPLATPPQGHELSDELPAVIYVDGYGNCMSGLRAERVAASSRLRVGEAELRFARTFGAATPGVPFWYENSLGLVELALACGRADTRLGAAPGTPVAIVVDG